MGGEGVYLVLTGSNLRLCPAALSFIQKSAQKLQQSKAVTQQSEQNCSHYAKHLCVIQISTCTLYKSVQNCSHYGKHCTLYKSVQNCSHYAKHCTLYKSVQNCSHYGKDLYSIQISAELQQIPCTVTQRSGHKYSKASQAALDNTSVK